MALNVEFSAIFFALYCFGIMLVYDTLSVVLDCVDTPRIMYRCCKICMRLAM